MNILTYFFTQNAPRVKFVWRRSKRSTQRESRFRRILKIFFKFSLLVLNLEPFEFHFQLWKKSERNLFFTFHFSKKVKAIWMFIVGDINKEMKFYSSSDSPSMSSISSYSASSRSSSRSSALLVLSMLTPSGWSHLRSRPPLAPCQTILL